MLLDTVQGLPPYLFIMLGLYSGLRREEILALQGDCVFLDETTPYLSVRRAGRTEHNRPVVSTVLKTPAAKRDIPIPKMCIRDRYYQSAFSLRNGKQVCKYRNKSQYASGTRCRVSSGI